MEPVGTVHVSEGKYSVQVEKKYIPALTNIEGYSHLQIVWWGHLTDKPENRGKLIADRLFKNAPGKMGIFATRSPVRPNPVLITTIKVTGIDLEKGLITTPYIDAEDGTPVLDIKPYVPMERVKNLMVPEWFRHWPQWFEEAASFDWKAQINS